MFGLRFLENRRSRQNSREAYRSQKKKVAVSRLKVLRAIYKIGPCYYREVSRHMRIIDGSVAPRISELRRNGYIKVAYVNKGLAGTSVNYYKVTGKGLKFLRENIGVKA